MADEKKKYRVTVHGTLMHNRKSYRKDDIIELTDEEAKTLHSLRSKPIDAEPVEEAAPEALKEPKAPETPKVTENGKPKDSKKK